MQRKYHWHYPSTRNVNIKLDWALRHQLWHHTANTYTPHQHIQSHSLLFTSSPANHSEPHNTQHDIFPFQFSLLWISHDFVILIHWHVKKNTYSKRQSNQRAKSVKRSYGTTTKSGKVERKQVNKNPVTQKKTFTVDLRTIETIWWIERKSNDVW